MVCCLITFKTSFFRQEFHTFHQCADVAPSDRHLTQSHQGHCRRTAAAKTLVHSSETYTMALPELSVRMTFFLSVSLSGQRQKEVRTGAFRSSSGSTAPSGIRGGKLFKLE